MPVASSGGLPRRARRTAAGGLSALLVAALPVGCGAGGESGSGLSWPQSRQVVDRSGLAWALDGVVHLGDGTEIDTGLDLEEFVVAGDGVLVSDGGLHVVAQDGTDTDVGIETAALAGSPDGTMVAVIDLTTGETDGFGTARAEVVVVDLSTGQEVLRTTQGMGGLDDDLAGVYPEVDLDLRFLDDSTLAVAGVDQDYLVDVAEGTTAPLEAAGSPFDADPTVSPDGEWRIESPGGLRDQLVGPGGTVLEPQSASPRWNLEWWADDRTAVGYAITGGGSGEQVGDDAAIVLMACEVPAATCERHEQTQGQVAVRFPADSTSVEPYSLTPGYVED